MNYAYIYDVVRTPRGKGSSDGALYEVKPIELLGTVLDAMLNRNEFNTHEVDDVIIGCVTPVADQGANIAKSAISYKGWDHSIPAFQLNRFCASSLEAMSIAATKIMSGWSSFMVAGGVESMSRVPMGSDGGPLIYDPKVSTKIGFMPQGVGADLVATLNNYSREDLDKYTLLSHERAIAAQAYTEKHNSLVPVLDGNGLLILDKEEYLHRNTSIKDLNKLPIVFKEEGEQGYEQIALLKYPEIEKIQYLHTAGSSCGMVDGASLVLLGSKEKGGELGLKPKARIVAMASSSAEPTLMMGGGTAATEKVLKLAGMTKDDVDLWEYNEPFASVLLKYKDDFNIDIEKLNVNGGAIALGHPLGATGGILLASLLEALEQQNKKTGLLCIPTGMGMGMAAIIERV